MSKFISSAVNYSETQLLKTKNLSIILESYNQEILLNDSIKLNLNTDSKYMIPNNNMKYYMLIVNKSDITPNNINNKYKICYFFTLNNSNNNTDFYVEIDNDKCNFTRKNYLFEGYLYKNNSSSKTFLISDVLAIDSVIVKCEYSLRYSLINKIMLNQHLDDLNGHLNINIHSVFDINLETNNTNELFNIFKHNFIFKDEINSIEYIEEKCLKKTQSLMYSSQNDSTVLKFISKTKYIDVYNVYNIYSNDHEGILYIKTINDSKKIQQLARQFGLNEKITLPCVFNEKFKKWQFIDNN